MPHTRVAAGHPRNCAEILISQRLEAEHTLAIQLLNNRFNADNRMQSKSLGPIRQGELVGHRYPSDDLTQIQR